MFHLHYELDHLNQTLLERLKCFQESGEYKTRLLSARFLFYLKLLKSIV